MRKTKQELPANQVSPSLFATTKTNTYSTFYRNPQANLLPTHLSALAYSAVGHSFFFFFSPSSLNSSSIGNNRPAMRWLHSTTHHSLICQSSAARHITKEAPPRKLKQTSFPTCTPWTRCGQLSQSASPHPGGGLSLQ